MALRWRLHGARRSGRMRDAGPARLAKSGVHPDDPGLAPGTDWAWRAPVFDAAAADAPPHPAPVSVSGAVLCPGITLWHDLVGDPVRLERLDPGDGAGAGLQLVTTAAPGAGYAAVSLDLPDGVLAGLDTGFILQARLAIAAQDPGRLYLRLNIEHGPNTERLLRHLDLAVPGAAAAAGAITGTETGFDLGFVEMNPRRLVKIWLDVIVERPARNRVWLRDLVMSRHRRADI